MPTTSKVTSGRTSVNGSPTTMPKRSSESRGSRRPHRRPSAARPSTTRYRPCEHRGRRGRWRRARRTPGARRRGRRRYAVVPRGSRCPQGASARRRASAARSPSWSGSSEPEVERRGRRVPYVVVPLLERGAVVGADQGGGDGHAHHRDGDQGDDEERAERPAAGFADGDAGGESGGAQPRAPVLRGRRRRGRVR